jgi:hypothetical protein
VRSSVSSCRTFAVPKNSRASTVLPVQRAAGDHHRDLGLPGRDHVTRHRVVELVEAQHHGRTGVDQQVGQLAGLVHRVDRDGGAAGLPRRDKADHERGIVLHVDSQPVARAEPVFDQLGRDGVGCRVDVGHGEHAVEVPDGLGVRRARHRSLEHLQHRAVLRGDVRGDPVAVES